MRPCGDFRNCPFCDSDDIQDIYIRDGREIVCTDCGGNIIAFEPNASVKALERWNRRYDDPTAEEIAKAKLVDESPAYKKISAELKPLMDSVLNTEGRWKLNRDDTRSGRARRTRGETET